MTVVDGAIPAPVEYTALYPNPPQFNAEPSPHWTEQKLFETEFPIRPGWLGPHLNRQIFLCWFYRYLSVIRHTSQEEEKEKEKEGFSIFKWSRTERTERKNLINFIKNQIKKKRELIRVQTYQHWVPFWAPAKAKLKEVHRSIQEVAFIPGSLGNICMGRSLLLGPVPSGKHPI